MRDTFGLILNTALIILVVVVLVQMATIFPLTQHTVELYLSDVSAIAGGVK